MIDFIQVPAPAPSSHDPGASAPDGHFEEALSGAVAKTGEPAKVSSGNSGFREVLSELLDPVEEPGEPPEPAPIASGDTAVAAPDGAPVPVTGRWPHRFTVAIPHAGAEPPAEAPAAARPTESEPATPADRGPVQPALAAGPANNAPGALASPAALSPPSRLALDAKPAEAGSGLEVPIPARAAARPDAPVPPAPPAADELAPPPAEPRPGVESGVSRPVAGGVQPASPVAMQVDLPPPTSPTESRPQHGPAPTGPSSMAVETPPPAPADTPVSPHDTVAAPPPARQDQVAADAVAPEMGPAPAPPDSPSRAPSRPDPSAGPAAARGAIDSATAPVDVDPGTAEIQPGPAPLHDLAESVHRPAEASLPPSAARLAQRIEQWVERVEHRPPPNVLTLRSDAGDGLTIRVALEAGALRITVDGAQPNDVGWLRSAADQLRQRGFDLSGFDAGTASQHEDPEAWNDPGRPPEAQARSRARPRQTGLRL